MKSATCNIYEKMLRYSARVWKPMDKIKKRLEGAETPFYTCIKREHKVKKMVCKGPPNLEIPSIMRELKEA